MGCCGDRHRDDDLIHVKAEQKWDYITLTDFRSTSCFTFLSYCILYLTIIKSFAVYGVDTFTAVNLLAFSRWASQIKPKIPFGISKWIFSGCIILSFVLLAYRWIRAIRVIKSGGVAQSYLDPIAVRVQSTRMGSEGQGFRRFLVFAELTKSKKGADYVALFTYFNFEFLQQRRGAGREGQAPSDHLIRHAFHIRHLGLVDFEFSVIADHVLAVSVASYPE
ncbi:hypothetical protein CPSG_02039 [Coccidioides posadasii str. Silveira]|uniref:Uncharacterized protein n=1 Tax=Coccidioides posadasii (strain RMSCC 757 / Silveira) TaxID=443226 RepID=E9CX56_COCPS|nr:hypothetical protein CPSG_02039 [Coccidioides posadasii str. Silveira]